MGFSIASVVCIKSLFNSLAYDGGVSTFPFNLPPKKVFLKKLLGVLTYSENEDLKQICLNVTRVFFQSKRLGIDWGKSLLNLIGG